MKTTTVKHVSSLQKHDRFLIENEVDIREALRQTIISVNHITGIRRILAQGEKVILNEQGGYCGMKGVWEFVETPVKAA